MESERSVRSSSPVNQLLDIIIKSYNAVSLMVVCAAQNVNSFNFMEGISFPELYTKADLLSFLWAHAALAAGFRS